MGGLPAVLGGRWVLCCKGLRSIYVKGLGGLLGVVRPLFIAPVVDPGLPVVI